MFEFKFHSGFFFFQDRNFLRKITLLFLALAWSIVTAKITNANETSNNKNSANEVPKITAPKSYLPKSVTQEEILGNPPIIPAQAFKADYWIEKIKNEGENPEKLLKSKQEVRAFNRNVLKRGYLGKPLNFSKTVSLNLVSNYLVQDLAHMRSYIKFDSKGKRRRDPEFNIYLRSLINFAWLQKKVEDEKNIKVRFANVIRGVKLRAFPTDEVFVRRKGDHEFDIFIRSFLPVFSVVTILHQTVDKSWYFVESKFSRGWVRREYLQVASKNRVAEFDQLNLSLEAGKQVVTAPFTSLYKKRGKKNGNERNSKNDDNVNDDSVNGYKVYKTMDNLPMGTLVTPVENGKTITMKRKELVEIKFPKTGVYYLEKKAIAEQFLPFNREQILRQSFKFLGSRYGWGGGNGQTDCSLFLYYLFRSLGLLTPRSSSLQIKMDHHYDLKPGGNELEKYLKSAGSATSLVYISGPNHILLKVGREKGRNIFIHSTWSYKDMTHEYLLRSVVLSDLSLGKKGFHGSLAFKARKIGSFLEF